MPLPKGHFNGMDGKEKKRSDEFITKMDAERMSKKI